MRSSDPATATTSSTRATAWVVDWPGTQPSRTTRAGVSQATIDYLSARNSVDPSTLVTQANDGQIRRYYAGDDALTFAQERWPVSAAGAPDALGTPIEVGPEKNNLTSIGDATTFVEGHMLDHMNDLWQQQYGPTGATPAR